MPNAANAEAMGFEEPVVAGVFGAFVVVVGLAAAAVADPDLDGEGGRDVCAATVAGPPMGLVPVMEQT